MSIVYTSQEEIEVYRFSWPVAIGIPLLALVFQAVVPFRLSVFSIFDLPLLITIFFAVARRSPVSGLLAGCVIGLVQDSLTHQPLGVYGIAKTAVGFAASSLGVKIDVENPGSRLLMTIAFYLLHEGVYWLVATGLVGREVTWRWGYIGIAALSNAVLAVVLFAILDRFKKRA